MSLLTILYNLCILPLELFFEIVYSLANQIIDNPGLSIIFLSLAMNFLVLPLYKKADAMQAEERDLEQKLNPWVTHIKKTFKGDERFMMMQTFYRQNNYKPTYALKGSISLLLEIPFFIAAYNFLSECEILNGVSFGPIANLGAPDQMLQLGFITLNFLPILMTLVNIVSSAIYTKGMSFKSKLQLYGMAAIFLVFLYNSPAGLVFYWTLNNVFSLVKNIFYKLKNPKFVLCVLSSMTSLCFIIYILLHPMITVRRQFFVLAFLLCLQLPLLLYYLEQKYHFQSNQAITNKEKLSFWFSAITMAILTGLLIPSSLVKASPEEFLNVMSNYTPTIYILQACLLAFGTFVIWFGIFYMLASNQGKRVMTFMMWSITAVSIINFMFFGKNYGTLSPDLIYENKPIFLMKDQLVNILVISIVMLVLYIIYKKKQEIGRIACLAGSIAAIVLSVSNIVFINKNTKAQAEQLRKEAQNVLSIPLSTKGKNVIVLMMDRAISGYLPYIFEEKPEIKKQFDGFTYYPNTISFGGHTNFGVPSVFGGYEYTPKAMNARPDEKLETKHDESLKVMPLLFDAHGFKATISDPTYSGYTWIPDLSIYDEYETIDTYMTKGRFNLFADETLDQKWKRDFFCYSMFKVSPVLLQSAIYNKGLYNEINVDATYVEKNTKQASGYNQNFLNSFETLKQLSNLTKVSNDDQNHFFMMCNESTHEPTILQKPNYEPSLNVDNHEYDSKHPNDYTINGRKMHMDTPKQVGHYHINVASYIELGKWFDFLKEKGVYDNSRIIVVADHGYSLRQFDDMIYGKGFRDDGQLFNPLLLVKDFNATGFKTDTTFMTNADVVTIATNGLIENPINPMTQLPLNNDKKYTEQLEIITSRKYNPLENNGNTYIPGKWVTVHDNIFDVNNWSKLPGIH